MSTVKQIPENTKIYTSLPRCCKYQSVLSGGAQPVFSAKTKKPIGFAALPEKVGGVCVFWTK